MDKRLEDDVRGMTPPMCFILKEVIRIFTSFLSTGLLTRPDWDKVNGLMELFCEDFKQTEEGKRWTEEFVE